MHCGARLCSTKLGASHSIGSALSLTKDYVSGCLTRIIELDHKYGFYGDNFAEIVPRKIVVEFSSPNIAKKFHAGHLRSTNVGRAISNILEAPGNDVTRVNYLGDWGMQFAILSIGFQKFGNEESLLENPIMHLNDVYVKANADATFDTIHPVAEELFCKMEDGDADALKFWKKCREVTLQEYHKLYKNINVDFDRFECESMYCLKAKKLIMDLRNRGMLIQCPTGAEGIDIPNSSWFQNSRNAALTYANLLKSNGTTLYLARDVAAAIERREKYSFDKMVYITDKAQDGHFLQLFSILERLDCEWAKRDENVLKHIGFGRVTGMSTRKGESIFLDEIFSDAYQRTKQERLMHSTRKRDIEDEEHIIRNLALSGLICSDLKGKFSKDYQFSWSRALASKGDTGIFVQYSHSRLHSLMQNCGVEIDVRANCALLLNEPQALELFEHLMKYNNICWNAYTKLEPSYLTNYMFKLSHLIAKAHHQLKVKNVDLTLAQPRLLLFHCAQITLRNCMKTLGIEPLDRM